MSIGHLNGGNCTKEEAEQYERDFPQIAQERAYNVTIARNARIVHDIRLARDEVERVMYEEGQRMHGENQARLSNAFRILHELEQHLTS